MKENEVKINDEVYVVRKFGDRKHGFDFQIDKCKVQYKGTEAFIPYGFHELRESYQEIDYYNCTKTLKEAKEIVRSLVKVHYPETTSIKFISRYGGIYYDVVVDEKEE